MKVCLVTNIPAPYREKVYELLNSNINMNFFVIYCAKSEYDREWKFDHGKYIRTFLAGERKGKIHNNINIWKKLNDISPDILITNGFYPTMLYAFLWCQIKGKRHLVFTDGTFNSENDLSLLHKVVRRIVFSRTDCFIGTSLGSQNLYKSYKIAPEKIFRTFLCIDNKSFLPDNRTIKKYDIMFSGQFIDRKMPFFFIEVAKYIKVKLGRCKVLLLGNGKLKEEMINKLNFYSIDYEYPGFISQRNLPQYYKQAKVFLFPTRNDPWGIVVNEAMASGLPVITCENAGVANDLVIDHYNGFILPLNEILWAEKVVELLRNENLYSAMSMNAIQEVQKYTFENAATGIADAISYIKDLH